MTDHIKRLEAAAEAIDPDSLRAAKTAVMLGCEEYLRWAKRFSLRLETVGQEELCKFARALVLTMLGHLPTRPETCPFCIQYGGDRSCAGCGYAAVHGRCDSDASSFSIFIEAFSDLGRVVYQDLDGGVLIFSSPIKAREEICGFIQVTTARSAELMADLPSASGMQFMLLKREYLKSMIGSVPAGLFSEAVEKKIQTVNWALKGYW